MNPALSILTLPSSSLPLTVKTPKNPRVQHRDPRLTHDQSREWKAFDKSVIAALRLRLPEFLDKVGVDLAPGGTRLVGICPVHNDTNPSFAVFGENHEMCGCYPCDYKGDVFATSIWLGRSSTFPQAVYDVARTLGVFVPQMPAGFTLPPPKLPKKKSLATQSYPYKPFELNRRILDEARSNLVEAFTNGDTIVDRIAFGLGISLSTLGKVAELGLHGRPYEKGLCFIYPEGLKWRNPDPLSKHRFEWLEGIPTMPWRANLITAEIETVYLTEGETDCLALIDVGMESNGKTLCVASPGTAFQEKWAAMFAGKRVVLCFDADEAGQNALHKVATCLRQHASSIEVFNITNTDEQYPN